MFSLYRIPVYLGFGLDRIPVYSGFGLDRIPVYSGFGLDRFPVYSGFGLDRFCSLFGVWFRQVSLYYKDLYHLSFIFSAKKIASIELIYNV